MCGFAGIAWTSGRPCVDARARVERMTESIAHRGPDGRGTIEAPFAVVGFRRLAIVGLETGDQPVRNEDGSIEVMLNGEIYNHAELRQSLEARGHAVTGGSDAAILPHLYEELGERFVDRLDGMFAMCVVDRIAGRTLLYRDRLGIKPLFHAATRDGVVFGSELKAVLASGLVERTIDRASLFGALNFFYTPGPHTLLEGVRKLQPGTCLAIDCFGNAAARPYHVLGAATARRAGPADLGRLDRMLERSVSARVNADVPVGISLSGGLDSSLLAAYAARCAGQRVKAFTMACNGTDDEEVRSARLVAQALDLEHIVVDAPADDYLADAPRLVWESDEPVSDPAFYGARRIAAAAAPFVKVLLFGAGADEVFAGYHHYDYRLRHRTAERLPAAALRGFARLLPSRANGLISAALPGPRRFGTHAWAMSNIAPADRSALAALLRESRDPLASLEACFHTTRRCSDLDRQLYADTLTYLPDQVLPALDRATMAASIEGRVPYLDHALVEHAFTIHGRHKIDRRHGPKALLRRLAADLLPADVLRRRKAGFPSPVLGWMPGKLFPVLQQAIRRDESLTAQHLPAHWIRRHLATPERVAEHARFAHALLWAEIWHELVVTRALDACPDSSLVDLFEMPRRTARAA